MDSASATLPPPHDHSALEKYSTCLSHLESLSLSSPPCRPSLDHQLQLLQQWAARVGIRPRGPDAVHLVLDEPRLNRPSVLSTLQSLLANLQECTANADGPTFKIAGVDVLGASAGRNRLLSHHQKVSACIPEIAKHIGVLQDVTYDLQSYSSYRQPEHRVGHSSSSIDGTIDGSDKSSSTSTTPTHRYAGIKRPRRQSEPTVEHSAHSTGYPVSRGASSDALSDYMRDKARLQTTLPPLSSATSGYTSPEAASAYPRMKMMPPRDPNASGPVFIEAPRSANVRDSTTRRPFAASPSTPSDADRSPQSDEFRRLTSKAERALAPRGRDSISPPGAQQQPTKLTKTGRVSKALRGEPVHACNICDKVYTRAEHLRRHRSNHTRQHARSMPGIANLIPPP